MGSSSQGSPGFEGQRASLFGEALSFMKIPLGGVWDKAFLWYHEITDF
jgi:hypothetical protein